MKRKLKTVLAIVFVLCTFFPSAGVSDAAVKKMLKLKNSSITVNKGSTTTLKVSKNTTGSKVKFKSSNKAIATVTGRGVVKGIKEGKVVVSATAGKKTSKCTVTVKNTVAEVKELKFDNDGYQGIDQNHAYENAVTVVPQNALDKNVTYTSSDSSIVSVDAKGSITGHKEGKAYITAEASNGVKAVCEVEVSAYAYEDHTEKELVPKDTTLHVKQGSVNLGDTVSETGTSLGTADRIDKENEYGGQTYVYNRDTSSVVFVYVNGGKVVGYFTNARTFETAGVTSNSTSGDIKELSGGGDIWIIPDKYTVSLRYDATDDGVPKGIFVTDGSIVQEGGAETYLRKASPYLISCQELECLDLFNGFRGREGIAPLKLDTRISDVARSHSLDMQVRKYFDHTNPDGVNAGRRLLNAGIRLGFGGEVIGQCAPAGVTSDFCEIITSKKHMDIIMDPYIIYAGPGVIIGRNENEASFITVDFAY